MSGGLMAITEQFIKDVELQRIRSIQYDGDASRLPGMFRRIRQVGIPSKWEHLENWPIVCDCGGIQQFKMGLSYTQFKCPIDREMYWDPDTVLAVLDVFRMGNGGWERNQDRIVKLVLGKGKYDADMAKAMSAISGLGLKEEVITEAAKDAVLRDYSPELSAVPVKMADLDQSWLKEAPKSEMRVEVGKQYRRRDVFNSLTLHTLVISEVGTALSRDRVHGSVANRRDALAEFMNRAGQRVTLTQASIPFDILDDTLVTCTKITHSGSRSQISVEMAFVDREGRTYEVTEVEKIR